MTEMNIKPKIRNAALVGALAAVAATAWATNETLYSTTPYVPGNTVVPSDTAVSETLAPNESLVTTTDAIAAPEAPAPVAAPPVVSVADREIAQPGITVEQQRLTEDERLQAIVMDRIAVMHNISGKISVQSKDSVVTLSGYTVTAGQAYRAAREASSVVGVKYVQNDIRPRIGGSV
jgi:hypothetical protein